MKIPLKTRVVQVGSRLMVLREYHASHLDLIRFKWFCVGLALGLLAALGI